MHGTLTGDAAEELGKILRGKSYGKEEEDEGNEVDDEAFEVCVRNI